MAGAPETGAAAPSVSTGRGPAGPLAGQLVHHLPHTLARSHSDVCKFPCETWGLFLSVSPGGGGQTPRSCPALLASSPAPLHIQLPTYTPLLLR